MVHQLPHALVKAGVVVDGNRNGIGKHNRIKPQRENVRKWAKASGGCVMFAQSNAYVRY